MLPHMTTGRRHELERCDLPVAGMTCASCAARIESSLGRPARGRHRRRQLRHQPGDGHLRPRGHRARRRSRPRSPTSATRCPTPSPTTPRPTSCATSAAPRWSRWCSASPCSRSRWCPGLQFAGWEWVAFALVDADHPVVGVALPPRHAREPASRRDDDGHAGVAGHARRVRVVGGGGGLPRRGRTTGMSMGAVFGGAGDGPQVYFETASAIVALLLLGKYFEARARGRSSHALRALLELGAKTARLENGDEIPVASLRVGDRFVVRPGEKIATDGIGGRRRVGGRRVDAHGRAGAGRRRRRATRCSAPRSTPAAGSWSRPPGSATTPRWRRSRAWWRRRRGRRRRCNGWPTASPRCSCPWSS